MSIKRFDEFINESYLLGARAPLYHTTNIYAASFILNDNEIKLGGNDGSVSLTRDKNFKILDEAVTFVLDGEKLSQNFKIVPFDYFNFSHKTKADPRRTSPQDVEFEEVIKKPIKHLDMFLLEIRLNDSIEKSRNAPRNTREELREAYEDLINAIIDYKENNYSSKVKVFFKGKEVETEFLKNEIKDNLVDENIYHKNSGTRVTVNKFADEDSYKVYYSSYNPIIGKDPDDFLKFINAKGIKHSKGGVNMLKMDKSNVEKLKNSMLTLESKQEGAPLTTAELNKIKTFYHATSKANLGTIIQDGIKKGKVEKVVYLADSSQNAAKFLAVRGMKEIIVFPIDASKLDKKELEESFDHSYDFFKCRAYLYYGDIPVEAIDFDKIMQYL